MSEHACCGFASICNKEPRSYSLTPSPSLVRWGGEPEGKKAKTCGLGGEQFNRMAKGDENYNTDKKHIQHAVFSPPNAQLAPD